MENIESLSTTRSTIEKRTAIAQCMNDFPLGKGVGLVHGSLVKIFEISSQHGTAN